jgi:hypothetical protein
MGKKTIGSRSSLALPDEAKLAGFMVLHSQTCEASGIGEEGLTLEAQGRLKGTIQDQGADPDRKKVVAAGPVSRIRQAALKTDNLFEISRRKVSTMSTLSVLAGFYLTPASQRRACGLLAVKKLICERPAEKPFATEMRHSPERTCQMPAYQA